MAFFQADNLHVSMLADGVATLVLDVAGKKVNVLNRRVFQDMEAALERVEREQTFRLLLVRSGKESGFIAGADLEEFKNIQTAQEAIELSALGQRLFDRLARLPLPTVAVIGGPCLGGGLELALACDYRVVIDEPRTQLGLPELELGVVPGWGGTQRLPRLIGLEPALLMILGSRRLDARQALDWGLADALQGQDEEEPPAFLAAPVKRPRPGLPLRTWRQKLLESNPLGRWLIYRGTQRILRHKVPDDFPAHQEAMQVVFAGLRQGVVAGLAREREANGRLALSSACRNLIRLFFLREQARKRPEVAAGERVGRIGVVGAGTMGAGIAQLAALKGCEVVIREINEMGLATGVLRIAALFGQALERGLLTQQEYQRKLNAVHGTIAWKGFADVDLVLEAVVEDQAIKQAVFRDLEEHASPSAILASNTSAIPLQRLQEGLRKPERVAGLHFFNPVHKMPLVEVIRTPATSEQTVATLVRWVLQLGKTPILVKDSPGFLVNRILTPYLNEAILLAQEGLPVDRIDQTMRRFGMPLGPLELLDQIGLDVAASVARTMAPAFGERFAPNAGFRQLREKGMLGQKSGLGFYRYQGRRKRVHPAAVAVLRSASGPGQLNWLDGLSPADQTGVARERMVCPMVNEAAACLGEGIAEGPDAIDLAMVLGTSWAPHRGGPLRYGAERGYDKILAALENLVSRFGPRFTPCEELRRLAAGEEKKAEGSIRDQL